MHSYPAAHQCIILLKHLYALSQYSQTVKLNVRKLWTTCVKCTKGAFMSVLFKRTSDTSIYKTSSQYTRRCVGVIIWKAIKLWQAHKLRLGLAMAHKMTLNALREPLVYGWNNNVSVDLLRDTNHCWTMLHRLRLFISIHVSGCLHPVPHWRRLMWTCSARFCIVIA